MAEIEAILVKFSLCVGFRLVGPPLIGGTIGEVFLISAALYSLIILVLLIQLSRLSTHPKRCGKLKIDGAIVDNSSVMIADTYVQKRVGLLNHSHLPKDMGLLIKHSRSVHTQGMLFPIDIVYLDKDGLVVSIRESAQPGAKKLPGPSHTKSVLELPEGAVQDYNIQPSTILQVTPCRP